MQEEASVKAPSVFVLRIKDFMQLMKPNLSFLVVFSSVIGYLLAPTASFDLLNVVLLFLGGLLVTGSANAINQILEKDTDKMMKRTQMRPMPDGRMHTREAWIFSILIGLAGIVLLATYFHFLAGLLSAISLAIYAFAYTPMKRIHPIAVLIGAIPGALPPFIGWVAATGTLSLGGWVLFLIQFFWQFPHFWSIAWLGFDDYSAAGMRMLPSNAGKTRFTGLQSMFYSIVLIPLALYARAVELTGNFGMWITIICGILYFITSLIFYIKNDAKSARRVMFASFFYLPIVLMALLFDKF